MQVKSMFHFGALTVLKGRLYCMYVHKHWSTGIMLSIISSISVYESAEAIKAPVVYLEMNIVENIVRIGAFAINCIE